MRIVKSESELTNCIVTEIALLTIYNKKLVSVNFTRRHRSKSKGILLIQVNRDYIKPIDQEDYKFNLMIDLYKTLCFLNDSEIESYMHTWYLINVTE